MYTLQENEDCSIDPTQGLTIRSRREGFYLRLTGLPGQQNHLWTGCDRLYICKRRKGG